MSSVQHDSETQAKNQQVFSAVAVFHRLNDKNEYEILVAKRSEVKKFLPGVFELPGGHIDFGEDIKTGLAREILEEFQVRTEIHDLFAEFTYVNEIKGSHSIELVYFATFIDDPEKIVLHPDDHSEIRWITEAQISDIQNDIKGADDPEITVLKKAFTILKGKGYKTQ